jgi:hypothetical protein
MRLIRIIALFVSIAASSANCQWDSIQHLDITCRNDDPLTPFDSLNGPYPDLLNEATQAVLSPDGSRIAFLCNTTREPALFGTVVYDLAHRILLKYLPDMAWPRWHPSGRKLLTNFQMYDLDRDSVFDLPCRLDFQIPAWSSSGKFIFYAATEGMYRSTEDGHDLTFLGRMPYGTIPLTDSTLIFMTQGISMDYYVIYNIHSGVRSDISMPSMSGIRRILWSSTFRQRFVAADFEENGGTRFNGGQYLGILDLERNTIRKVLHSQRLGNYYYPSWTAKGTLIVSYVCRVDSIYAVWEIDSNGVFLRQLIDRSLFDRCITSVASVPSTHSVSSLTAHPQPASHAVTIRYAISNIGTYSVSLIDLLGRELRRSDVSIPQSPFAGEVSFGLSGLAPGAYLVRLTHRSRVEAAKVILIE